MKKNHDFQGPPQRQVQDVVQQKLQQALAFHQKGKLSAAKAIYEDILKQTPDHFDALHLLGVIAYQTKNLHEVEELIGRAIKVNPNNAAAYSNRGIALSATVSPTPITGADEVRKSAVTFALGLGP